MLVYCLCMYKYVLELGTYVCTMSYYRVNILCWPLTSNKHFVKCVKVLQVQRERVQNHSALLRFVISCTSADVVWYTA